MKRTAINVCAFIALLVVDWAMVHSQKNYVEMQVFGKATKSEVWLRPYVAPAFNFKIVDGGEVKEAGLHCTWEKVSRPRAEHVDDVIVFTCGSHKLELQMVDFNN